MLSSPKLPIKYAHTSGVALIITLIITLNLTLTPTLTLTHIRRIEKEEAVLRDEKKQEAALRGKNSHMWAQALTLTLTLN